MRPASGSLLPLGSLGLQRIRQQWSRILESSIHTLQSLSEHGTIDVDRRQQFQHLILRTAPFNENTALPHLLGNDLGSITGEEFETRHQPQAFLARKYIGESRQHFFHPDIDGLGASADLFLKFGILPEIEGSCCSHECKSIAPKGAVVLAWFPDITIGVDQKHRHRQAEAT